MAAVVVNSDRDGDVGGGRGKGGGEDGNNGNSGNSEESSGDSIDWEVDQIKGTDGEKMMLMTVELGMKVTAEDI
jgi:hypothetical protein